MTWNFQVRVVFCLAGVVMIGLGSSGRTWVDFLLLGLGGLLVGIGFLAENK